MMTFSASILTLTFSPSTVHFFGPVKVAQPLINSAPDPFNNASTPLLRRVTIVSFQLTKATMSTSGLDSTEIPMSPPSLECFCSASKRSAACIIALLGIHPLIRHVPPALSPSTITVSSPS